MECRSYDEACEAANAGAEVVMLDNFEPEVMKTFILSLTPIVGDSEMKSVSDGNAKL